ncbi:uncharacterized protein TNCT_641091 [Trichonephila clavata]|uniref:Uncharacterized protein n=1 Tax=Trichonephila clavata TaxID=2740835 RepID=A0A8X6L0Z6_TRICU|nr:uncharacterized protein TNCT_641091 [Trichonephila clavata]
MQEKIDSGSSQRLDRTNKLTLCFGWIGFAIFMWICFDVLYFSEESYLKHISYNGFSGILSSLALAWIFYICATKQWGLMKRFLSIKAFLPLSRLSYASYLINFIVLLHYLLSSTKQAEAFNFLSMFVILFYVTFWTYIISFTVSLFFEVPISRVLRWIHDY